jgi:hypothetical protein
MVAFPVICFGVVRLGVIGLRVVSLGVIRFGVIGLRVVDCMIHCVMHLLVLLCVDMGVDLRLLRLHHGVDHLVCCVKSRWSKGHGFDELIYLPQLIAI